MPDIIRFLESWRKPFDILHHEPVDTAANHARALGVLPSQVAKTVVLDRHDGHALAVIPASRPLDMHLVRRAVGDPHGHLATEHELVRDYPEVELGAFPPIGPLAGAPVYVDPELLAHDTIVFPAGRRTETVRMRTDDLVRSETVTIIPLVAHADLAEAPS